MTNSKLNTTAALAVALGLSLTLITAPVSAAKKGPRSSVSAATVCDISRDMNGIIDSKYLNVTIRLTDKTSGSGYPVVKTWSVEALAKTERGNWKMDQVMFDSESGGPEAELQPIDISFDLCLLPEGAKAVNAAATITYDRNSLGDLRTIENMCSDDPNTDDVEEPAGIKLSPADRETISSLCPQ